MSWIVDYIQSKGGQIAVIFGGNEYSYTQLAEQIRMYYDEVQNKLYSGAVIAIISDYCFESIALFFALYENRNIIVPVTSRIEAEIEEKLSVAGCNYIISIEKGYLEFKEYFGKNETHLLICDLRTMNVSGLVLFSSGSTGVPKAMIHNLNTLIDSFRNKKGRNLTFLIFLMFDHIGGLNTLLSCLSMGTTMVFPVNRNPEHVCGLIEKYKVNVLPASPTFLNLILISESYMKYDLSSLRMITYGTEPMQDALLLRLKDVFPEVKFLQTFGTSETGISQTLSRSSTSTQLKIDDPNTEYKIVDGELFIRTKTQILGYLNYSMEHFTDDGWFKTGDLVEEMDDGYIKIVGRNKELINVGGEKVLPSEVESVLFQMERVKDCIVFGESNPITGQIVVAKILFDEDISVSDAKKKVTLFCQGKLERYKIPVRVLLMKEVEFSERFKKKRL
ncbi:class I adenylate-forming enzyme family protein [uncultured Bacteroides sp.]|uniref:class I adenylate-forming enzyme family protein n=1 Tax=uncultured Bacteroides sp. TaxID=162156 RepID=UPI002AAB13B2|nr:class I adenylate-forming enzyme family protein [uncultured Bacteroides sp.]